MIAGKLKLKMERTFAAPAATVFDAWTSAEVLLRWFHAEHDWETSEASVDLRVGGELRVVMRDPSVDEEYGGGGRYVEISAPERLAFTWTWDNEPGWEQLIEIDLEEQGDSTVMTFVQNGLWDDEAVTSHRGGWTGAFDNLEGALED